MKLLDWGKQLARTAMWRYKGRFAEDDFFLAMRHLHYLEVERYNPRIPNTIKRTAWMGLTDTLGGIDYYVVSNQITGKPEVLPIDFTTLDNIENWRLQLKLRKAVARQTVLVWPMNLTSKEFVRMLRLARMGQKQALKELESRFKLAAEVYLGKREVREFWTGNAA